MSDKAHDTRPESIQQRLLNRLVSFHLLRQCRIKKSCPLLGILLLAVICAVALPVINANVIYPAYTEIMSGTFEDSARRLAIHILPPSLREGVLAHDVLNTPHFLADIYRLEHNFGLLGVKVFSPDGHTLYATDPEDIDKFNTNPAFMDLVAKGHVHSWLVENKTHSPQGKTVTSSAIHVYVPFMRDNNFLGAFEIVFDVTHPKQQLDRFTAYATYGTILVCVSLVIIVLFLLRMEIARTAAQQQTEVMRANVEQITRHDIKTPLLGALNGIHYLENYTKLDEDQMEMLDHMREAVNTGMDLINRSLDVYKMETGQYAYDPTELDILSVYRRVVSDLSGFALDQEVSMLATLSGNLLKRQDSIILWSEETLCYAILANLIKNAIEASAPNDQITISMEVNDNFSLAIHNPTAVPQPIRDHFFEKYATAGKRTGTGLGTYSARLMAEVIGGTLSMESSDEDGTTVIVTLPMLPPL